MGFIKVSIALFLLRLDCSRKVYRWILSVSATIVAIWSSVTFFWYLFQCRPVQAQWDYTIPQAQCVTSEQVVNAAYALSIMTILSDWLYALLPIPMLWGLEMTKQTKFAVVVVLSLGIFASIATLIRLKFLAGINNTADLLCKQLHLRFAICLMREPDVLLTRKSVTANDALIWTLMEPGVAIIAASIPTLRPLVQKLRINKKASLRNPWSKQTRSAKNAEQSNKTRSYKPGELTLIDIETGGRNAEYTMPPKALTPVSTSFEE